MMEGGGYRWGCCQRVSWHCVSIVDVSTDNSRISDVITGLDSATTEKRLVLCVLSCITSIAAASDGFEAMTCMIFSAHKTQKAQHAHSS